MDALAIAQVIDKLKDELARRPNEARVAIIGRTPAALSFVGALLSMGLSHHLLGIYDECGTAAGDALPTDARPLADLARDKPNLVVVAADGEKEHLIESALPFLSVDTKLIIGGFGHFRFKDRVYDRETGNAFAPSFANGYPNTLIHIFQCLGNAARLNLTGVVAEFGMFKGGTTMLISRFIEALGQRWRVYGFDTFDGFPAPRSPLDMYAHPDCVYLDEETVRRFFAARDVEIVAGDIVETVSVLKDQDIVLAFVDTDNYTSAARVLEVISDRIVRGGAIVFDHFTGRDRFLYTLGERMAAKVLLDDPRYFNLHDTGVFMRVA
jgi:O-methyltransferase